MVETVVTLVLSVFLSTGQVLHTERTMPDENMCWVEARSFTSHPPDIYEGAVALGAGCVTYGRKT